MYRTDFSIDLLDFDFYNGKSQNPTSDVTCWILTFITGIVKIQQVEWSVVTCWILTFTTEKVKIQRVTTVHFTRWILTFITAKVKIQRVITPNYLMTRWILTYPLFWPMILILKKDSQVILVKKAQKTLSH